MIDLTLIALAALVGVAGHAHRRWLHGTRTDRLHGTLATETAATPSMDTADDAGTNRFEATSMHLSARAGSLIAVDERRGMVHLASLHGRQVESARLPLAQLGSVVTLENGAPIASGDASARVRSFRLRIALPDERRSLHDVELLDRPCGRDSATYAAARRVAALCGGIEPDGSLTADPVAPDPIVSSPATSDPAASESARPDIPPAATAASGQTWSWPSRLSHAATASLLVATIAAMQLAGRELLADEASSIAATDAAAPADGSGTGAPATPEARARAFAATLDEREAELAGIDGRRSVVEDALAALEEARTLPLDASAAARVERLGQGLLERHVRELPNYRTTFARDARHGPLRVGAWTRGEGNRVLELTRHDFADADTRDSLWNALAGEVRTLGFERVEFRTFRGGDPLRTLVFAGTGFVPVAPHLASTD